MEKFFGAAKRALSDAGTLFREAAHDAAYDFRDNALRGFGLPRLISSVASLSVAGVAAAGTASITLEMISKVFGTRECKTCNGWEGLRCTMCLGAGHVQYSISGLTKAKRESLESLASAVVDGRGEITHYPAGYNAGYPLPYKQCPTCNGTGVMKCTACKGFAWKSKFSMDDIMDVPWKTWDAYQKTHPPQERLYESMKDPALAAFLLYERDELEGGFKYDEDEKMKIMSTYQRSMKYDQIRELVAKRKPGWEQLQDALHAIDPERARRDPVIIQDVPSYKARRQIEAEVDSLQVPPRPADWTTKFDLPLRKSYWTEEEQKDPVKSEEINVLLQAQERLVGEILDTAWANEWRQKKFQEIVQEKIHPYIEAEETGKKIEREREKVQTPPKTSAPREARRESGTPTKASDSKAVPQKVETTQKPDAKKKKDKKQERTERLAKQAAEREAALAKAKKGSQ